MEIFLHCPGRRPMALAMWISPFENNGYAYGNIMMADSSRLFGCLSDG